MELSETTRNTNGAIGRYAGTGLLLIPLCSPKGEHRHGDKACEGGSRGKVPLENGWQNQAGRLMDAARLKTLERHRGNFGLPIPPGMVGLDADSPEDFKRLGAALRAEGLKFWCQRTGRGGHFLLLQPASGEVRNAVKRGCDGAIYDVRGASGQVVVFPSVHASGAEYVWEVAPWDLPKEALSVLPERFVRMEDAAAAPVVRSAENGAPVTEGGRNSGLASFAGAMRRRGMGQEAILAALLKENETRCSPPLPEAEVRAIAKSISRYAPEAAENEAPSSWETPIPFQSYQLPKFPTEVLPHWLRQLVERLAVATQTPPDLAGLLALAALAVACAKKVAAMVRYGWIEPLNLYVVVALLPGSRKTAVFSEIEEPIIEYEEEAAKEAGPAIAAAETGHRILQGKYQHVQGKASKATGPDAEQLAKEATALAEQLAGIKIPVVPRLAADDVTSERLATMLKEQDGRMAVMSAEGGIFELMAGRYSKDGAPNFEVYLKGHAGDTIRVDRVGRPPEYIYRPALTMALAVQPEVLTGLVRKQGFRGRGLLGRLLYAIPFNLLGCRKVDAPPLPESVREAYKQGMRRLLAIPLNQDEKGRIKSYLLRFSREGAARLREFEAWIEPRLAEFGALGHMTDWGGKLAGAVVRICGLLHLAEHSESAAPWDTPVSRETVERAIRLGEYLIPHARAAYACMGADPAIEDAKRILAWVRREGLESFSKRELFQALRGYFKRVSQLESPLAVLQEHGYIRIRAAEPRGGAGRKPSPVYEVNPLWQGSGRDSEHSEDSEEQADAPPHPEHSENEDIDPHLNPSLSMNGDGEPTPAQSELVSDQGPQNAQNPQNAPAWDELPWPEASLDAERRFGHRAARLYPFLRKRIGSTQGEGVLLRVGDDCVDVELDNAPGKMSSLPIEAVRPMIRHNGGPGA